MKSFTLDSNCIIDLEEYRPAAAHLEELKRLCHSGVIELAVVSVSASENQPTGQALRDYAEFEAKLERAGLTSARELYPIGIWDLGYWDHMLWSGEELERQVYGIKDILFPSVQHEPPTEPAANSKWRNQMCDVLVAWAHGFHKTDYLITRDKNFHKKATDLVQYGIRNIVTPEEALKLAKCT
ncbi:hypothetical protein [Methylophaga lonarensis]|uniref:hypothetical protein n=1 Tax=Methylophaga lonarensis TaxID=999151 RepID=UPI003D2A705D